MTQDYYYDTNVEWSEGRRGTLRSEGLPDFPVAAPPEFQGDEGIWTPEHLFVSSVNVCFMTTFLAIAELSKLEFASFKCHARGKLEKIEGKGYKISEIMLRPTIVIPDGRAKDRAARILEKAERNCLISNSIQSAVRLDPEIVIEAAKPELARLAAGSTL